MKKIILLSVFSFFALSAFGQEYKELIDQGSYTVQYISEIAEQHFDTVGRGRGTGYKQFKRWQYFAERSMDETGKLKSPQFYYNELQNYNATTNVEGLAYRTVVGTWEEMGPTYWNSTSGWNPGVGRITSIAVDENNLNHIIAGSETGGVWKSIDGGATWTVLTDNLSNIDVYALAIDPMDSTIYYWGSTGGTILKSEDSGSTWTMHANVPGGTVNKILIDPTNSMKIYASAQGSGLYKSIDGGMSWNSIFFVATGSGYDFEFKPGDSDVIYASGNDYYKSTDGGATFLKIDGSGVNQFGNGPKMIGVSADDPNIVYVLEASSGIFGALYVSTDSGTTFTKRDHTGINFFGYDTNGADALGQAPRDMDITVNPNNANDVHIAGINTWRSTDAGVNFNITSQWVPSSASSLGIGYCHADVDIMHFAGTGANAKLFVGTDGGIYRADNPTTVNANYYTDLTPGLGIRQFYKIGVSQTNPVVVTGGSQDNGTSVLAANGNWTDWLGADGMEGFVDKNDSQIMYGTSQFGFMYKTFSGGTSISGVTQPDGKGGQNNWNWVVPFEQDPIVPNTIYVAYDEVYKSIDGGSSWVSISQNFIADIDHFKVAPTNNQIMYLAINGAFWYTINGGSSWMQSALNLGTNGRINEIAVHPTNPNKIAIATNTSQKVYVSTDNGASFSSVSWDLPNFSAQALAWQNNVEEGLYVGMNYGVYYTDNGLGNTWVPFNSGLPNVRINELQVNTADNKIYAATYGRGLWRSDLYDETLSIDDFALDDLLMYPNPANEVVKLKWKNSDNVSIRVYDGLGKLIYYDKNVILLNEYDIDLSSFDSGIYFVKLNSLQGEITKKLILQ